MWTVKQVTMNELITLVMITIHNEFVQELNATVIWWLLMFGKCQDNRSD